MTTTYAEFRPTVPEYFNFAGDVVDKWAQDSGKLAILWVDDAGNEVRKTFCGPRPGLEKAGQRADRQRRPTR
jgi:hypothetical protein